MELVINIPEDEIWPTSSHGDYSQLGAEAAEMVEALDNKGYRREVVFKIAQMAAILANQD